MNGYDYDYDMLWHMCKLKYKDKFMKISCRRSWCLPDCPVQDPVMNKLWLCFDTFTVSWHSGLRFPWPPWHVDNDKTCKLSYEEPYDDTSMHDCLG